MQSATHNTTSMALQPFLIKVLKPFRSYLAGLLLVALVWAADISLQPYLTKVILDRLVKSTPSTVADLLLIPILLYLLRSLAMTLLFRLYDFVCLKMNPRLRQHITETLMRHMMGHSHSFYQNNFAGSLANKVNDVATGTRDMILIFTDRFVAVALAILIATFTLYQVNYIFAVIMLTWVVFILAISFYFGKRSVVMSDCVSEINSRNTGKIVDILSNMMSVRFFATYPRENQQIHNWTNESVEAEQKLDWYFLKLFLVQGLTYLAIQAFNFWFLVKGFQQGNISVGDFALILTINMYIIDILFMLSKEFSQFMEHLGKVTQGLRLTTEAHEINNKPDAKKLEVHQGEIRFKNVHFHYPHDEPLFSNKSIILRSGEKVGLVGYSGSGKTTFAHLILRLFDVQSGHILIDNQDITHVTQESLRESISMIPQDPALFHRSLIENIRYGRLDATDQEVITAAKRAHAHDFITTIPQGYSALVGERGIKLSGGQRQRIAIARAILKNAPILILDEATSSLDSITENIIQESLIELMKNKTTIVIAHRLSTLLHMDRILVFDEGKIAEDGSHEVLLSKQGLYKKLWDAQVGGFLPEAQI